MDTQTVFRTSLRGLEKLHEGKVRDIYSAGADALLIVTSDRLSAFDVVLPDPIPGKGRVLNEISNFWFARTRHIVPNHLTGRSVDELVSDPAEPRRTAGPLGHRAASADAAARGGGARLSDRFRMEGLSEDRQRVRRLSAA